MSEAAQAVQSNAGRHLELLCELQGLDWAGPALEQCTEGIACAVERPCWSEAHSKLKKERDERQTKLTKLEATTKREFKEWSSIQNSKGQRFLQRVKSGGSKDAVSKRIAKEEQEYVEAFEAERHEERALGLVIEMLSDLETSQSDLRPKVERHRSLKDQLDQLYNSVFQGETPAFPEEDEAENHAKACMLEFEEHQRGLNAEAASNALLARAHRALRACHNSMGEALQASQMDMWSRGAWADMIERSALAEAKQAAMAAAMLHRQAQQAHPTNAIPPMPRVQIAEGNFLSDVMFDNLFTDLRMHRLIQDSARQVVAAYNAETQIVKDSNARMQQCHARVQRATRALCVVFRSLSALKIGRRKAQNDLEQLRRTIFIDAALLQAATAAAPQAPVLQPSSSPMARPVSSSNPWADALIAASRRQEQESEQLDELPEYATEAPPSFESIARA